MSLIKHFFTRQFVFFLVIGCINTFNGVLLAALFHLIFPPTFAFVVGYLISLCLAYFLNSYFVFKQHLTLIRFLKFVVSYIPNFVIQLICVVTLINWLKLYPILAYGIAAVIGVPITFLIMKLFAFKQSHAS